jgi:hypothetical protein
MKRRTKKRPPPPAWLPDWKKRDAYPKESARTAEWRWQFLRRRDDFQVAFASLPSDGALYSNSPHGRWLKKRATPEVAAQFGLDYILDPACPGCPLGYFPDAPTFNVLAIVDDQVAWDRMGLILCRVDLAAPLDAQMRALQISLRAEADRRGLRATGRREHKMWRTYLRVLDAYAVGADLATIGRTLDGRSQAAGHAPAEVSRWFKAAKKQQQVLTGRPVKLTD